MDAVNFQSLNLVRDELVATIDMAASYLDDFTTADQKAEVLAQCADGVQQIVGIFKIIEFHGAERLSRELLTTIEHLNLQSDLSKQGRWLEVTSNTFVVLGRYIEYVQQTESRLPMLLIPRINELRVLRGEAALPESSFFQVDLIAVPKPPAVENIAVEDTKFKTAMRRIRHLYQIGLVGLIKQTHLESSVLMMRRALDRSRRMCSDGQPLATLWWLADVALEALVAEGMEFINTRKMLFGRIDRIIRQVELGGQSALDDRPPRGVIKELLYLINLSNHDSDQVRKVRELYKVTPFPFTDAELIKQRSLLQGPNQDTVGQLTQLLREDFAKAKDIVEDASSGEPYRIEDLDGFIKLLSRLVETLKLVRLEDACKALRKIRQKANGWSVLERIEPTDLEEVANTFLYVDAAIGSASDIDFVDSNNAKVDVKAEQDVVASNLLIEAKKIAITEIETSLSQVKGEMESLDTADFDDKHLGDIDERLTRASGAMRMLELQQASSILSRCSRFVREGFTEQDQQDQVESKLEAFADTIISVEYYLNTASKRFAMDKSVLKLAEESLATLGYPRNMLSAECA